MEKKKYKLFFASSMTHPLRNEITQNIKKLNNERLKDFNVEFDLIAFSQTPVDDGSMDTQLQLNKHIAESDFFILLIDNNTKLGEKSFEEYKLALDTSKRNQNFRPYIKVFVSKESTEEVVSVKYIDDDGSEQDFEKRLGSDSSRYLEVIRDENGGEVIHKIENWLVNIAQYGIYYKQTELSYEIHLKNVTQDNVRGVKNIIAERN